MVPTRSPGLTLAMATLFCAIDHGHLVIALQFGDGALRDQQSAGFYPRDRAYLGVLPGPQNIAGVREKRRQLNGAGRLIHLAVGEEEPAFLRVGAAVGKDQIQRQLRYFYTGERE